MHRLLQPFQAPLECAHHALPKVVDRADEPIRDGLAEFMEDKLLELGHTFLCCLQVRGLLASFKTDVLEGQVDDLYGCVKV